MTSPPPRDCFTPAFNGALEAAAISRTLDACANRCREGLRVLEDALRFQFDDPFYSIELKQIRHELTAILNQLGQADWPANRDTLNDVGTQTTLRSEQHRESRMDVIRANMKRVQEALRSLEEFGKLFNPGLSSGFSQLRYRMYTLEKGVEALLRSTRRLLDCHVYLLVTAAQCRLGPERVIREAAAAGVKAVQIREKSLSDRELLAYAKRVREWTSAEDVLVIVNDRADIAAAAGADGVHLGQDDLDVASARKILGAEGLIGVSTHHPEQVRNALLEGADYLGVGPVFPSNTKEFTAFPGIDFVGQVAAMTCLPWFAIGGLQSDNLQQVRQAGAERIAVSSAVCGSENPGQVVHDLQQRLSQESS